MHPLVHLVFLSLSLYLPLLVPLVFSYVIFSQSLVSWMSQISALMACFGSPDTMCVSRSSSISTTLASSLGSLILLSTFFLLAHAHYLSKVDPPFYLLLVACTPFFGGFFSLDAKTGHMAELWQETPCNVADVIKAFFRSLPEPLLGQEQSPRLMLSCGMNSLSAGLCTKCALHTSNISFSN